MRLTEEELAGALREERPEVDPAFAAALDDWAAAGFPRAQRPGGAERAPSLWDRLRAAPPRKVLLPVGAAASLAVIVGIGISQLNTTPDGPALTGGDAATSESVPEQPAATEDLGRAAGGEAQGDAPLGAKVEGDLKESLNDVAPTEPAAPGRDRRVAQNVDLTLASEPEDVRGVADGVNEVVNRYRGFVVSSSVQSGDSEVPGGAQFDLRVPARSIQPALADLSELAHVQARTEGTIDITQEFTSAEDRIEEASAARRKLLAELDAADTAGEIAAIRAQLRNVNAELDAARTQLAQARQRIQLVPVTVSIVAEEGVDSGDWSIGDALDDAGEVLSTAAGIVVVAGAVLLPLALVGLLVGLALRARTGRSRERALDD